MSERMWYAIAAAVDEMAVEVSEWECVCWYFLVVALHWDCMCSLYWILVQSSTNNNNNRIGKQVIKMRCVPRLWVEALKGRESEIKRARIFKHHPYVPRFASNFDIHSQIQYPHDTPLALSLSLYLCLSRLRCAWDIKLMFSLAFVCPFPMKCTVGWYFVCWH